MDASELRGYLDRTAWEPPLTGNAQHKAAWATGYNTLIVSAAGMTEAGDPWVKHCDADTGLEIVDGLLVPGFSLGYRLNRCYFVAPPNTIENVFYEDSQAAGAGTNADLVRSINDAICRVTVPSTSQEVT